MLLFIVLAIASLVYGTGAVTPALADISRAFPDKSRETIQMIATVPPLMIMITTVICGHLSRRIRKKTLVLFGMTLYAVGGLLPAFGGGITFILVMRGLYGAGCGFLIPLSQGLIADFFEGRDRNVYMGYRSSTAAIFGMFFTTAGGYLCAFHWRQTFFAYLWVLPVFLLILLKMPEPAKSSAAESGDKRELTRTMWFFVGMYFLYNVFMMCFHTNAAFVMSAAQVGTARTIAFIITISNIGGIAAGVLLGRVTRVMKNFTLIFALGFLAVGFAMLNFVNSAVLFAVSCAVWGFGFGTFVPAIALKVISSVPKSAATRALAILTCSMGVGQFISPRVFTYINGIIGLEGPRASWVVAAVCFTGAFFVSLLKTAVTNFAQPANSIRNNS